MTNRILSIILKAETEATLKEMISERDAHPFKGFTI